MTPRDVTIDESLARVAPGLALGLVRATVTVGPGGAALDAALAEQCAHVAAGVDLETLAQVPQVAALRSAYRALGKDPSRYRGSQEALLRRVLQGKGVPRINSVVDVNSLVSLATRQSVGSYDAGRIAGAVTFRAGAPGESYAAIGRGPINLDGLPLFADAQGPFGSPTSDSERTMVTEATTDLLMVLISFTGADRLGDQVAQAAELLERHAAATAVGTAVVEAPGR